MSVLRKVLVAAVVATAAFIGVGVHTAGATGLCAGHGGIVGASSITDSGGHTETRVYCADGYMHIFT
jgi:hypothetical protein